MTVIVKYDEKGNPYYRSAKGAGSTESERARAKEFDELLKNKLKKLEKHLRGKGYSEKESKANVELYWELGAVLRSIFFDSGLIDETEKHLYWQAAALYVPKSLTAKDRGPNRQHLEYCFRLAGFPLDKATKMKWGEWVYLFDSPGINREHRFDKWLEIKMSGEPEKFSRMHIRVFVQSINKMLGTIETKDLSDKQISRCYEAAWLIKELFVKEGKDVTNEDLKESLRNGIEKNYQHLGEVIEGSREPESFAQLVGKGLKTE